ncbi:MAG: hypothetical protein KIT87_28895, partial [Anaerolineae bacterium]|nr:hypothetical protein [Anaerolineae bacterium]
MKRFALTIALVTLVALVLAACGGAQPAAQQQQPAQQAPAQQAPAQKPAEQKPAEQPKAPAAAPTTAPAQQPAAKPAEAKAGGTITEGSFADAKTLTSILSNDTSSGYVLSMLGNGLVKISPDNLLPIPDLATKWTVSPDNLTYTFTL